MDTVTLGRTGLNVTPICFGTWQLGGDWGETDRDAAIAAIRRARELGINFFDTAQGYGFGESEELLAEALRDDLDHRRDEVILATKGGLRPADNEMGVERDAGAEWLRQGVDESLEHLGVDHIDVYQVHWPDDSTPVPETAGVLEELVREGKIRHVGVSNFNADQMYGFEEYRAVETLQPPYHMFRREIEGSTLGWCADHDVGVLVYGPLAHGLLTGALDSDTSFEDDDWRAGSSVFSGEDFETNLAVVERLGDFASDKGVKLPQLAIAWVLANDAVDCAIVGTRDPDHIAEAAEAAEIELDENELGEIDEILADAVSVGGPAPEGEVEPAR